MNESLSQEMNKLGHSACNDNIIITNKITVEWKLIKITSESIGTVDACKVRSLI
jgi:hypothetical protein